MKGWRMLVAGATLVGALTAPSTAQAGRYLDDAGWGALSMLANVVYMPTKLVYATLGGLTGGMAYACTVGDLDTAESIWSASMGGSYVVTPGMLRGEQPVVFAAVPGWSTVSAEASAQDPLGWPSVEVEDDDFEGTTFGRSTTPSSLADESIGGF